MPFWELYGIAAGTVIVSAVLLLAILVTAANIWVRRR